MDLLVAHVMILVAAVAIAAVGVIVHGYSLDHQTSLVAFSPAVCRLIHYY